MKAVNKKDLIKKVKFRKEQKAIILVDNGVCSLQVDVDVTGIQFEFNGTAEITPQLPEGWILQGNGSRMIMIALQGNPIQNQALFNYKGNIEITKAIICNDKGERLSEAIKRSNANWGSQEFNFNRDTTNWENYKDTKRVGKVKKTIYHLPDYDLPKVEKIKRKKQENYKKFTRKKRETSRSTGGY
tara:strand:+ start:3442 stop:3999 length:558 start_codon:yes stop_codon:yes gene_type:complete